MTGIGGGLGGSVGIAAETTYGTFVAPTRWVEVHSAKLQERMHVAQGTGLAHGRTMDLGSRRRPMWADAGGDMEMEFLNEGMALLCQHLMGSNATLTQVGTTTAYTLAASYGVPDNQNYLSMQSLVPHTDGTVTPENYHGCKIQKATFSIDTQNPLMVTLTVDSQFKEETTVAGTPSYTSNSKIFTSLGMAFKAGTLGSEVTLDGVRKFTLTLERTLKTDRIYVGQSVPAGAVYPAKDEPITNGLTKLTGSMDVDLLTTNKAALWDLYHTQAAVPSIVASFTGDPIGSSGKNDQLVLNATQCFIDQNGTPELDGPDIVTATLNWTGLIDSANDSPFTLNLTTGDTTF